FSPSEGVIFMAATNAHESLDKALVRPGRFDRQIPIPLPDISGRTKILEVHSRGILISPDIDLSIVARGTPGFSGADLSNLLNQAAIRASKNSANFVNLDDLEWAKEKIIMGSERKSAIISDHDKKLTAYHEGGHTLTAMYTPGAMPLHKVTVIPRGNALGVTMQLPENESNGYTKKELLAMLDVCMGGRVAEELIFGPDEITTGASSDLEKATSIANEMICRYGMGEKAGLSTWNDKDLAAASAHTKMAVETEVNALLEGARNRAMILLKNHKDELHRLAKALVEHETLTVEEVKLLAK
ncbi:ATP-dependent zinc metalloprotease FTSH 4, mitochondrial, partial [Nowakowskiella sp. JEL0078]